MKEEIEVVSYSGYRFAEKPKNFIWQDKKYEILEIKRRWVEEQRQSRKRYFEVLACLQGDTASGVNTFVISYDEQVDRWFIER